MASFKEFIAENAHQGFDLMGKLKTVEDLLNMKRVERSLKSFAAFEEAVQADQVYNVTLVEAKDAANYVFQDAFDRAHNACKWTHFDHPVHKELESKGYSWNELPFHIDGGNAKKVIRSYTAAIKATDDAETQADMTKLMRIAEAYSYFIDAFKAVQSKVIKGRKPAAVNPNAFHSAMGSAHSVATVRTHLLKSITPPLDDFEAQLKKYYESELRFLAKKLDGKTEIKPSEIAGYTTMVFQACYDYKASGWDANRMYKDIKIRASAEHYPAKEAAAARKLVEETFLHKNALKLSSLLDKKGNLTSIDVLPGVPVKLHNGAGTLTSIMQVKFADGAEFTVRNKVIINSSSAGKQFYQYPTTFHDVKLADGTKLESPSEEKMVKVFGG